MRICVSKWLSFDCLGYIKAVQCVWCALPNPGLAGCKICCSTAGSVNTRICRPSTSARKQLFGGNDASNCSSVNVGRSRWVTDSRASRESVKAVFPDAIRLFVLASCCHIKTAAVTAVATTTVAPARVALRTKRARRKAVSATCLVPWSSPRTSFNNCRSDSDRSRFISRPPHDECAQLRADAGEL